MAIWSPSGDVLCLPLPEIPTAEDICFPGGFCLSHVWNGINQIPNAADIWLQFYSQIGPAMSGLAPIFTIIDAILAVFRCFEGTIEFAKSLDPTDLIKCVPELVEKINALLSLIPQLSIPRMAKAIVQGLAALLRAIATDLRYVQQQLARIAAGIDDAHDLGDVSLLSFLSCAEKTIEDQALSTAEALKGIGRIVLLINLLMALFGGPEIPCFGALLEDLDQLDAVIAALLAIADLLQQLADLIPDPQLAITLVLGDLEC